MAKPSKRLSLKSETLRTLSGAALDAAIGGAVGGCIPDQTLTLTQPRTGKIGATADATVDRSNYHTCHSHLCMMNLGMRRQGK